MIATWSRGDAGYNMDEQLLVALRDQIRSHPWWHARTTLAIALLERYGVRPPARLVDVGCGWGTTLAGLERKGYTVTGIDISRRALEMLDAEDATRDLIEADIEQGLEDSGRFDAALSLDVIEHLDDDRGALTRIGQLVKPGGLVIVSVPARPDLFSEFDVVQGHRRRYLASGLRQAFESTGLAVERTFYWGGWMVPLLKRKRTAKLPPAGVAAEEIYRRHLRLPPMPARSLLDMAFAIDRYVSLAGINPTGTSLFAVARRR